MTKKTCASLLIFAVLAGLFASGCATARINRFRGFAQAGVAYTQATDVVLEEAGAAAIATDSMVLEKVRMDLSIDERAEIILEHNNLMRERLKLLSDLRNHGLLLRSYFEALAALAETDAPSGIGDAAQGLVASLSELHPRIAEAKVGDLAVSSFVGKAAKLIVARFQLQALERELEANAESIERELDLQQAALSAITEQMETDLMAKLLQRESNEVVLPYAGEDSLPRNWAHQRQEILQAHISVGSAKAAAAAAGKMKISFVSLVEGRFTDGDLSTLINDINEIVTLIEEIRGVNK
jgi:hypothetical protein